MSAGVVEECPHEMTRQFCSFCKTKDRKTVNRAATWNRDGAPGGGGGYGNYDPPIRPPYTEAKFDGVCIGCNGDIETGDIIGLRHDKWVCVECAADDDQQTARSLHPSEGDHHGRTS
jgi:hypothetical protein